MAEHQELINAMLSITNVLLTAGEETPRYQELVTLVPWNFIAQILNLFLQMFLIKKFLFKPIREVLEKRKAKADAEISDATKAKEELGWTAEYGIKEMCADSWRWQKNNPNGYDD